jgi:hypothetical protein
MEILLRKPHGTATHYFHKRFQSTPSTTTATSLAGRVRVCRGVAMGRAGAGGGGGVGGLSCDHISLVVDLKFGCSVFVYMCGCG